MDFISATQSVIGRVQAYLVPDQQCLTPRNWQSLGLPCANAALYDWACILIGNLRNAPDGKTYHIGGMYLEFDNSADTISTPAITRGESLDYYNNLNTNYPVRDYLRVALIATEGENTDASLFTTYNRGRFYAHTAGVLGVNGLTFADTANSVVYGGALVAYREFADASQDLIFSRFYFPAESHVAKAPSSQIGVAWEITGN